MTKDELTAWALKSGWQMIEGHPSLVKPQRQTQAIARLVLKGTVVNVEVKKPSGKWEKVAGAAYGDLEADPDDGTPRGLPILNTPTFTKLMQDNKDARLFSGLR